MTTRTFDITGPDGTKFKFEALADGRVKITTGEVGAQVHTNAEGMLKMLNGLLGGDVKRESNGDHAHTHHHHDQEVGHGHSH